MQKPVINQERLNDKVRLVRKVNYTSSILSIAFAAVCYFLLDIKQIVPHVFLVFGILNLANAFVFRYHNRLTITYNISSILALIASLAITVYSGGINSPFIFTLALIVFAGYVNTRKYGQAYINVIFLLIVLIYSQSIAEFSFTANMIPEKSRNLYSFFCVVFAVYLLGNVFGKNLLRTHHKLYKAKQELSERVIEKETLLKEIHHRVKNNLQTVSSLLNLQSRSVDDAKIKSLFKSSQNRVISMAMVHEMLYMHDDMVKIECNTYVKQLSEYLLRSIKGADTKIKLKIDIPNIQLDINTAIPLGLLINEAITNALKYGIQNEEEGEIHIAIKQEDEKDYVLNIGDNGIGFADKINFKNTKTLGLRLIHNLTRQLKGSICKDETKQGTNYIVKFQEISEEFHSIA